MKRLGLGAVVLLLVTGCGGIATTQTFSPLMFFLPGIAENKAVNPPQIVPITRTNAPAQVLALQQGSVSAN